MAISEISSVLLTMTPIFLVIIPYILMRYRLHPTLNKLYDLSPIYKGFYFRLMVGFLAVYIFYYLIPAGIYLSGRLLLGKPSLVDPVLDAVPLVDLPFYLFWLIAQVFINNFFFNFVFFIFPSIFGFSTILALIILLILLRRQEGGSLREKFRLLTLSQETNPAEQIKNNLTHPEWRKQKDILKVILAIIPISLLLITSILRVLGQVEDPIATVQTGFGWFIDNFFVYLASIIISVQLLYSSRIYYHGNFVGERLRNEMVRSVSTVGGFLSLVTLLFSFLEKPETIPATLFFLSYLIMSTILLVLFVDLFEPIAIFLLSKTISYISNLNYAKIQAVFTPRVVKNVILTLFVVIIVNILSYGLFYAFGIIMQTDTPLQLIGPLDTFFFRDLIQSYFFLAMGTSFQIFVYILLISAVPFLRKALNSKNLFFNAGFIYLITLIGSIFSTVLLMLNYHSYTQLLPFFGDLSPPVPINPIFLETRSLLLTQEELNWWLTSFFVRVNIEGGASLFLPRVTPLAIGGKADVLIYLRIAAIPPVLFYPLFLLLFMGVFASLLESKFQSYTVPTGKFTERKIFASSFLPSLEEIQLSPTSYLLGLNKAADMDKNIFEEDSLSFTILEILKEDGFILISELKDEIEGLELSKLYTELTKLSLENEETQPFIQVYSFEYGYTYEEAELDSLHVMMTDGRAVYSKEFQGKSEVDPVLIAGLFAAITSFSREATRSEQFLRTIDHGDVVLIIEYGQNCFAALIADRLTAVHRSKLRRFLDSFEEHYKEILPNWMGDLDVFSEAHELAEDIFQ